MARFTVVVPHNEASNVAAMDKTAPNAKGFHVDQQCRSPRLSLT